VNVVYVIFVSVSVIVLIVVVGPCCNWEVSFWINLG